MTLLFWNEEDENESMRKKRDQECTVRAFFAYFPSHSPWLLFCVLSFSGEHADDYLLLVFKGVNVDGEVRKRPPLMQREKCLQYRREKAKNAAGLHNGNALFVSTTMAAPDMVTMAALQCGFRQRKVTADILTSVGVLKRRPQGFMDLLGDPQVADIDTRR